MVCEAIQFHHFPEAGITKENDVHPWVALLILAQSAVFHATESKEETMAVYHFYASDDKTLDALLDVIGLTGNDMKSLKDAVSSWLN